MKARIFLAGFVGATAIGATLSAANAATQSLTCTTFKGPLRITTGGTYTGCFQSTNANTVAISIATTQPVTIQNAVIRHMGNGIQSAASGVRLTVFNSIFQQSNPGAVVEHRDIRLDEPAAVVIKRNSFVGGDGTWVGGSTINPLIVDANFARNIGTYPHPTEDNCCIQFLQLANVKTSNGEIAWNHTQNSSPAYVEDNINLWNTQGADATHSINIYHNLIDGGYPSINSNRQYTGGGIMTGDGKGAYTQVHDNTVISTTNYGVSAGGTDGGGPGITLINNLLINDTLGTDGRHYYSDFGQAITGHNVASSSVKGNKYNWLRDNTTTQFSCWPDAICSNATNVRVNTTEQQARAAWESSRKVAGVAVGVA